MATVYVGNLPSDARSETLENIFSRYGKVVSIQLVRARNSRRRAGSYGFVEMAESDEASAAVNQLNGQYFRGFLLRVHPARPTHSTVATSGNAH